MVRRVCHHGLNFAWHLNPYQMHNGLLRQIIKCEGRTRLFSTAVFPVRLAAET